MATASPTPPPPQSRTVHAATATPRPHSAAAPLGAVLAFTFLNSIGTGVLTNGVFFLTKRAFGFGPGENYGLGLLQGVTYIAGALLAGPALRRLIGRFPSVTERRVLGGLMVLLALLCALPVLADRLGTGAGWTPWVMIGVYSPLTGALWPIVEAFLSGGRSARQLRSATGTFNIVWSSALVVGYWAMAPLIETHPLLVILGVGVVHIASLGLLPGLPDRPARHADGAHEPHPPVYRDLLGLFRLELPVSYMVLSALTPYLPTILERLGISANWATPVASTWLASRVLTFAALQRWHGWHGRWSAAIAGAVLTMIGFSAAVLSPRIGSAQLGLGVLFPALAVFGVGMGTIYTAALYYAMEVGSAQVDAGGVHEALIGGGYTAGPACGSAAIVAVSQAGRGAAVEPAVVGIVAAVAAPVLTYALIRAWRHAAADRAGVGSVHAPGRRSDKPAS